MFSRDKKADRRGVVLDVNQGIIITGRVDGDVVFVGGQGVPLTELRLPWRTAKNTIESLLSWKTRLTRLVGRDAVCADLIDWSQNKDSRLSVRLLHGPGGSGKTRLASEVADTLRQQGWAAGHIDLEKPAAFLPGENGTLLLVDYPEERPSVIEKLMGCLGTMEEPGQPLRLLLLSRHGPVYWSGTLEASSARELVDPSIMMPPMPAADPWELFSLAWEQACNVLQVPVDVLPLTEEQFNQWLMQDSLHLRPLIILAYAVQLAYEPENWRLKGAEIIDSMAVRECARWRKESENTGMDWAALERLRGLASIPGSLNAGQLRELASDLELGLNLPRPEEIVDCVHRTGEMQDHQLPGVEPDLLAVSILVKVLDEGHDKAGEWLWKALDISESLNPTLERMGRLAYDAVHTLGHAWPEEALADAVAGQVERCVKLHGALSQRIAPILLSLAIAVYRTLVDVVGDDSSKAGVLNNLSNHLAGAGFNDESLKVIQQSVAIRERLAAQQPEVYEPDLAMSLANLSLRLHNAEQSQEALKISQQAVAIYERLAKQEPELHEPGLVRGLNNLSMCLSKVTLNDEALKAVQRAVAILERLFEKEPELYEPDLAMCLNNLSSALFEMCNYEAAMEASQRAVNIYMHLASRQPELYKLDLAMTLDNLSACLGKIGRSEEALEARQRSVDILNI